MPNERDWIATEIHDTRFYEYTIQLLITGSRYLSLANIVLFVGLLALMYFIPLRDAYYITSQNGEMKPISALNHGEIKRRIAADQQAAKVVQHQ